MKTIKKQILNLRPYSWVDLILMAFLAKFSVTKFLAFSFGDTILVVEVLFWWFFFNSILEMKKNHSYRAQVPKILPILFLIPTITLAFWKNVVSLIPLFISIVGILLYLKKNEKKFWGITSCVVRGLIQSFFFIFLFAFLNQQIGIEQIVLSMAVFLLFTERAILGDLRDEKPDGGRKKLTVAVILGTQKTKWLAIVILLISNLLLYFYFDSIFLVLPILLMMILLFFYSNGYILHQLMIFTTSSLFVNYIGLSTGQNFILLNLVYFGILLNLIFYSALERKSNPKFN